MDNIALSVSVCTIDLYIIMRTISLELNANRLKLLDSVYVCGHMINYRACCTLNCMPLITFATGRLYY